MQPTVEIPRAQIEQMIVRLERIEWALLQYQRALTAMMGDTNGQQAQEGTPAQDRTASPQRASESRDG